LFAPRLSALVLALGTTLAASAGAAGLDLSRYSLSQTFALPTSTASESSSITWNWDNDHLYVVGDEGDHITEITRSGAVVSNMRLSGFDDTEALTYVGGGQFVMGEERIQTVSRLTYTAGGSLARSSVPHAVLGGEVGNIGLEGISYDRVTGQYVSVKEKAPQAVRGGGIDFTTGTNSMLDLFTPNLGVADLSDIQVLSSFAGTDYQDHLLVFSQESGKLLEITRSGEVVSSLDFSAHSGTTEGVTITSDGTIYLTDESPNVYVLTAAPITAPVPEPGTYALMLGGLGVVGFIARRRSRGELPS
jgi:uncharacterized protein YjiK